MGQGGSLTGRVEVEVSWVRLSEWCRARGVLWGGIVESFNVFSNRRTCKRSRGLLAAVLHAWRHCVGEYCLSHPAAATRPPGTACGPR